MLSPRMILVLFGVAPVDGQNDLVIRFSMHHRRQRKTMKSLNPYLMFSGNCKEALTFYRECLGGEIVSLTTFAESPIDVPEECSQRVFNSEFRADGVLFMASDDLPTNEVDQGSNFALFVVFSESEEQDQVFSKLSKGGKIQFPLENGFGMLVDKFGIQWMLAGQ